MMKSRSSFCFLKRKPASKSPEQEIKKLKKVMTNLRRLRKVTTSLRRRTASQRTEPKRSSKLKILSRLKKKPK